MPWTLRQLTCICSSFSANQIKLTNSLYVYAFQYLPPPFESAIHEQCKSHLTSFTHAHCYDNRTIGYQLCLWVQPSDMRFSHRSIDSALISISWFDIVSSSLTAWTERHPQSYQEICSVGDANDAKMMGFNTQTCGVQRRHEVQLNVIIWDKIRRSVYKCM